MELRFNSNAIALIIRSYLLLSITFLDLPTTSGIETCTRDTPRLLIVSFDGFRYDYLSKTETPNFDKFIREGVYAKDGIKNAFITKTFPNHYSIVTGRWEESHGIVANKMYDPESNQNFSIGTPSEYNPMWWDQADPIWVTNQNQGHKSAALFWPGTDVEINGTYPSYFRDYNESVPFDVRANQIVNWLKIDSQINLGILYFQEPDYTGHHFGPDSPEMIKTIQLMDNTTGKLIDFLKAAGIYDCLNIILTADHGMTQLSKKRVIQLDDYIDSEKYRLVDSSAVAAIWPLKADDLEGLYQNLSNKHPNMTVYKKEDIPEHFHYTHNERIMPLIAVADLGWVITKTTKGYTYQNGTHGYSNDYKQMRPFFLARGPSFKQGFNFNDSSIFFNIDIYPMMCDILKINPMPNNGSLERVKFLFATNEGRTPIFSGSMALGLFVGIVLLVVCIIVLTAACARQRQNRQEHKYYSQKKGQTDIAPYTELLLESSTDAEDGEA